MTTPSSDSSSPSEQTPRWGLGLLIFCLLLFVVVSSFWLFNKVQALATDWEITNPEFGVISEPAATADVSGETGQEGETAVEEAPVISSDALKPWEGKERVTILLLGIDQRCDEEGPTRTDTMMVMTIDPVDLTASMLSLPRDLWVEIPGFGVDKINNAHFLGEVFEYPGGGPALAVKTVEAALGIEINYFATVNFDAFIRGVDEIGGIDIEVPEAINDPKYPDNCYGYEGFSIQSGMQHLDGQTALKYARTRATFGGDVDRANRQQQVILAIRDKILSVNMVPQLLARAPELWRISQDNFRTDLSINQAVQLALLVEKIPDGNIRTEVLDFNYVYNETAPDGQAVLVPVRENIRELRNELFAPPAIPTPSFEDLPDGMREEDARIAIMNGTRIFGLAAASETYLEDLGFSIVEIGNADSADFQTTQIYDFGSNPDTIAYLVRLMGLRPLNVFPGEDPEGDYDVLIILGDDWRVPGMVLPTPTPTAVP